MSTDPEEPATSPEPEPTAPADPATPEISADDAHQDHPEPADVPESEAPPEPYKYEAADLAPAALALDKAFTRLLDGPEGHLVLEELPEATGLKPPLRVELDNIVSRDLDSGGRGNPNINFALEPWLPDPAGASADVLQLWTELTTTLTAPAAKARLAELLMAAKHGKVHEHARDAVAHYRDAVAGKPTDFRVSTYLGRAWTIACQFGQVDLQDAVLDEFETRIQSGIWKQDVVALGMLAIMCRKPATPSRTATLHGTAAAALEKIAARSVKSFMIEEISDLRRSIITGPDAEAFKRAVRADELAGLRRVAEVSQSPGNRMINLRDAAEFATRHSFSVELKEIQAELESISFEDLALERFAFEGELPPWLPNFRMHPFTAGRHWQSGLFEFFTFEVPSGSVASIEESVAGRSGLLAFIPTLLLGNTGLPRRQLTSEDEEHAHAMAQHGGFMAQTSGRVLAVGLYRMAEKYGIPDQDDLRKFIIQEFPHCDSAAADILAKAFRMHWRGETLEAASIAIPAAEAAARRLLREADQGIYQVQVGEASGGYPTLRGLLQALDDLCLDEGWAWYLKWLLLGPIGQNIRNDVTHGFLTHLDPVHSALVLRAAALLITMSTSVDGDYKTLQPAQHPPVAGIRRVLDDAAKVTSNGLLTAQIGLERLRITLRRSRDRV